MIKKQKSTIQKWLIAIHLCDDNNNEHRIHIDELPDGHHEADLRAR